MIIKKCTDAQRVEALAPFIATLQYNPQLNEWQATLKPKGIIRAMSFESLIFFIERHVLTEVIYLVTEVLGMHYKDVVKRDRGTETADLRFVVAIIAIRLYPTIRQGTISKVFGWSNRCTVSHALKQAEVEQVKVKLRKVYRVYPELRNGKIEILNRN